MKSKGHSGIGTLVVVLRPHIDDALIFGQGYMPATTRTRQPIPYNPTRADVTKNGCRGYANLLRKGRWGWVLIGSCNHGLSDVVYRD